MSSIGSRSLLLVLLLSLGVGCRSASLHPVDSDVLEIQAWVEEGAGAEGPAVHARFRNRGEDPVAFSATFGYGTTSWIGLVILDPQGRQVPYPSEVDLFELPPYRCLESGESVLWSVTPLDWRLIVGGKEVGDSHGFDLPPGRYRVQVRYAGSAALGDHRCRPLQGVTRSSWRELSIGM